MTFGCPVVAYRNSSIPEVTSSAALLVPPGGSLAKPIAQVLTNVNQRKKMIQAGKERAQLFSWQRTASITLDVLEEAA